MRSAANVSRPARQSPIQAAAMASARRSCLWLSSQAAARTVPTSAGSTRQYAIGRFAGLAADAAALALSDPAHPESRRPAQALRLLEAARGLA